MKNDTASFFGPLFWGMLRSTHSLAVELAFASEPVTLQRHVFFTHWAVKALAEWASGFLLCSHIFVRARVPTMSVRNNRAVVLSLPCRSGFSTEAISSCQKMPSGSGHW